MGKKGRAAVLLAASAVAVIGFGGATRLVSGGAEGASAGGELEAKALIESAEAHFRATTLTYDQWLRRNYPPGVRETTEWAKAFADLQAAKDVLVETGTPPTTTAATTTAPPTTTAPTTTGPSPGPVPGEIPPPPVDINSMPAAPGQCGSPAQTVNLSSTRTITGTVRDTTFNVISGMAIALDMTAGSRLECVKLVTNGLVSNIGVSGRGVGTVKDVWVSAPGAYAGIYAVKGFEGITYATRAENAVYLTGSNVTLPANALIRTFDAEGFGVRVIDLRDSNLQGTFYTDAAGTTNRNPSGTGFAVWSNTHNVTFGYVVARRNPGYGFEIVEGSGSSTPTADVTAKVVDTDQAGAFDGDPGITITGGTANVTLEQVVVRNHSLCMTVGEYDSGGTRLERNLTIGAFYGENCAYGGLRAEFGDGLDVAAIKLVNTGTVQRDLMEGSLQIGRAVGPNGLPTKYLNVNIRGLDQSGTTLVPDYGVDVAAGSTGTITGIVRSWRLAQVRNNSATIVRVN